jgi:YhcH/YjgK/YiaL family protein
MIYDTLSNLYLYSPLVPQIQTIVALLKKEDLNDKEPGEYSLPIGKSHYTISDCNASLEHTRFEMHKENTVICIMLDGSAQMVLTWREHARGLPYDPVKDLVLLEGDPTGVINGTKGHFVIFFPGEPFKIGNSLEIEKSVKKAIFTCID